MEQQLIDLISWNLKIPSAQINLYSDFADDLHLDAIDKLLLIADLEAQFDIYLTPEEVAVIQTVQDASFLFKNKKAA